MRDADCQLSQQDIAIICMFKKQKQNKNKKQKQTKRQLYPYTI